MEEKVKKVLDYINSSIMGVFLSVDGDAVSFSYNDETKGYTMRNGTKAQEISLNELLVLLNRPELKEAVEEEAKRIDEETTRLTGLKQKYTGEVDGLDIPEEDKERLKAMVKQMILPTSKVGMGNRVSIIDPKLEEAREDYISHRKEYEDKRNALITEIGKMQEQAKDASDEEKTKLEAEIEGKWKELTSIPSAPSILSQHFRLNDSGDIQLVTTIDGNMTFHDYQVMSMDQIAEFVQDKEIKVDPELLDLFEDYTK